MVEVRGTLDELYELFAEAAKKEARSTAKRAGKRAVKKVVKETPRKLSAWQKYIKRKANHIKFKSGPKKGMLNLKAMSKKFKGSRK